MTRVDELIAAARTLPPHERLQLIAAVVESLDALGAPPPLSRVRTARERLQPVTDIGDLKAGFWPEDETADAFIAFVRHDREAR
jgi:hypothetical protein